MRIQLTIAGLVAGLLLSGCETLAPAAGESVPVDPALAQYRKPLSGDGSLYAVDPAASTVAIYVYRGGAAARFGHNHVLAAPQIEGQVRAGDNVAAAQFSLRFRLDQLRIDDAAQRAATGGNFVSVRSAEDIAGTQKNMLKGLDAEHFPEVVINSIAVYGDWPVP
ncbi:MAG: hypothetical protein ACREVL_00570, partial [Solimonas sp.]